MTLFVREDIAPAPGGEVLEPGDLAMVPRAALSPEQGAAVLLPDGTSAAIFRLHDGSVHAVGNIDPYFGAPVICHGIVGDRGGVPTVASPLGKQVFCLRTGRCLDDPEVALPVFETTVLEDVIQLSIGGNKRETADRPS
jgi:nitrite reductase (NADH) small subunit